MLNANKTVDEGTSTLESVIQELEKHEKLIVRLEKRLCEQEEKHKILEDQLKNEIKCLKQEICQLRYVVLDVCNAILNL